jgi:hypothetical protein
MKKTALSIFTVIFLVVAVFGLLACACDHKSVKGERAKCCKWKKEHHEKMEQCPVMSMMMGAKHKSVVATSDGGVVIVMGNRVIKYDKDLNLVKEVEIKVDLEALHKKMMGMNKKCPMMQEGVERDPSEKDPEMPAHQS